MRGAAAAGVVLGALALTAPAGAGASVPELFAGFPEDRLAGEAAGRFAFPQGIAVQPELPGHLYVADLSNDRIDVLNPWGEFVRAFGWGVDKEDPEAELQTCTAETECQKGTRGAGTGQFDEPRSVALDSAGDLYVIDRGNPRVQKFSPEGELLLAFGWGVRDGSEELQTCGPQASPPTASCEAGIPGGEPGQLGGTDSITEEYWGSLAIGPSDQLFVSHSYEEPGGGYGSRIEKFSSAGAYGESIAMPAGEVISSIAVDGEGKLYASFRFGKKPNVVRKIQPSAPYEEVEPKEFETEEDTAQRLALDGAGHLYATVERHFEGEKQPRRVLEFDPEGNCLDCGSNGEGGQSGFDRSEASQLRGIATGAACGPTNVYVSHHDAVGDYLKIFGPHPDTEICPPPEVPPTIEASWAAAVDLREADLATSINPHFWADTTYQLQYGTEPCSEGGCETVPATPQVLSEEVTGKAVTATVSLEGLEPATTYHYRFVAKSTGSGGEEVRGVGGVPGADGAEGTFRTFAPPEGIDCPNDAFRSGPAANLPDCRAYELVSPLEKNNGDVAPNGIQTVTGSYAPAGLEQSSVSGERLAYSSATAFADAQSSAWSTQYIAERIAGSEWRTHAISPPRGRLLGLEEPIAVLQFDTEFRVFSPDLCEGWLRTVTDAPLDPAHEVAGSTNLYRREDRLCEPGGADSYQALTTIAPADGSLELALELQGVAADGQSALYRSSDSLAGTDSPGALQDKLQLYVSGAGAQTRLACLLPAGAAVSCLAGTTFVANLPGYWSSLAGAISADGSRVFWSTPALRGGAIYARENPLAEPSAQEHGSALGTGVLREGKAEVTSASASKGAFEAGQRILGEGVPAGATIVAVEGKVLTLSAPATVEGTTIASLEAFSPCTEPTKACTVPVSAAGEALSGTSSSIFLAAATDGSRAIFLTKKEEKGKVVVSDLYEFDPDTEETRKIAPSAAGIVGTSKDASIAYFLSTEAIEAAEPNAEGEGPDPGDVNLYRYQASGEGSWRFIAALAEDDAKLGGGDGSHASPISVAPVMHSARVSPDGAQLAFTSLGRPTGYDNTDPATGKPAAEAYLYSAGANGGEGKLLCASCNPSGARPRGARVVNQRLDAARVPGWSNSFYAPRALAEDGKRLFFESYDALSPRDANGAQDVYQWQAPGKGTCTPEEPSYSPANGGCVELISAGTSPHDSEFRDADPTGKNVFFATLSSLVAHDYGLIDVYDAREGGGLPAPTSATPLCEGEACQSPPPAPADPTPASSAFRGPGNLSGQGSCKRSARSARRASRRAKRLRRSARRAKAPAARGRKLRSARRASRRAKATAKRARRCRRAAKRSAR